MPERKTLRIVHYLPAIRLAEGGVARAVLDWCTVLAARGHRVTLITADPSDVPAWSGSNEPTLLKLNSPPAFLELLPGESLQQISDALNDADVVHLHAPWIPSNIQLARRAKARNIPYLLTIHGMLDDWSMAQSTLKKKLFLRMFGARLLSDASAIHCTAREELRQASKWFSNPNTAVIPYVMDLEPFRNLPGKELAQKSFPALLRPEPKILFLSRLHPKKGPELLIDAVSKENVQLILAGSGDDAYVQSLRARVEALQINDRVTFTGLVTGDLKLSLYQACDLFVLPTSQENFGLVLPESLACETPIITTRGVDIFEELTEAGAIIVERTAETIASAIRVALSDATGLRELGARGRKWVFEHLDPDRVASQYEALYARVTASDPVSLEGRG
jgi:glycosyltransferase involved in cell wall biosynthesis